MFDTQSHILIIRNQKLKLHTITKRKEIVVTKGLPFR